MTFIYKIINQKITTTGDMYGLTLGPKYKILFDISFFFYLMFAMTGMIQVIVKTFMKVQKPLLSN